MILYLLFFCICFLIDYLIKHKRVSYAFFVVSLFVFLCFGYMTGSDWREYESLYENQYSKREFTREIGFIAVFEFFHGFISDFWLFNGMMKCLYLASLVKFINCFSPTPYTAVALGFANNLLFMILDCPMRFMMAMTLILFGIFLMVRYKTKKSIITGVILLLLSISFHLSMLIILFLILLVYFAPIFSKFNTFVVFLFFIGVFLFVGFSGIIDVAFNIINPLVGDERYNIFADKERNSLISINSIRYIVLFIIILANKDKIISCQYGVYIFFYACMYFFFYPITYSVPTMFRLNIFYGFFADISLVYIIYKRGRRSLRKYLECSIIISFTLFLLCRNCLTNEKLTPYSNSIPYIITGNHLPYSYRDSYNTNHHDAEFLF